jgi:glycosyltransferase involved in cell wall biosynthesis|tara:strand:- start:10806 stop:11741 length:936 start_codon:yes stop_codon:yes gene_type:complete
MKICIVGPGIMPIPPTGWGAVEILIWDYKQTLEKLGHEVVIVNTRDQNEIVRQCNSHNPDFVHVQYDEFYKVCDFIQCKNVAITSHFGYLDQENRYDGYYNIIMKGFINMRKSKIFALSPSIAEKYKKFGFDESRLKVVPNGVRDDLFKFEPECKYNERSICLAKVESRKRQYLLHDIDSLYFAGNIADNRYNKNNYLGEWSKEHLYDNLTDYANLVLLSDGEAHPLVCLEAMSSGLGLVLSEWATANLDTSLPFIDVIPEDKISDKDYVESIIKNNREKSITMREEIRQYVIDNFSWENIVKNHYLPNIV